MTSLKKFDYDGYRARYQTRSGSDPARWPIAVALIARIGDSVTENRGDGRPHKGIDIFVPSGTKVTASRKGTVLRVVDGRFSTRTPARRAGLFVDVLGIDTFVYRYLHLGIVTVKAGEHIQPGAAIGEVAAVHTSGLADRPHLHFEIRAADYQRATEDYGAPIDPLRLLPAYRGRA